MQINIKNIGKIRETNITIKGITVIAGKNDTGKSTVSKALHCFFNSLYNVEEKKL